MSLKGLQEFTRISRYAKYNPEKKRRETWDEMCDRVWDMHKKKYAGVWDLIKEDAEFAEKLMRKKRVLGSQRALQFGGDAILKKSERIYNCAASYCDRPGFFQEVLFLLLAGTGVGFSVQKHHVAKLPNISKREKGEKTFIVPDSIEGWADSIGVLVSSYFTSNVTFPEYQGYKINFDYSQIRPEGAPLSWGGRAPGSKGLKRAIELISDIFDNTLKLDVNRLTTIDAYDIVMHAADAVLAGGVRRSATICLFSPDDELMIKAKTGNWFITNPQRGRSNNSVLLVRSETTFELFQSLMKSVQEYGEPGFVWAESTETLFNPCVTKDSLIATKDGVFTAEDLIGKQFTALVDGKEYKSTEKGFFATGNKDLLKLKLHSGIELKVTPEHKILTSEGWKEAQDLVLDDEIIINNHKRNIVIDDQSLDYQKGYLLGSFIGDGNILSQYLDDKDNSAEVKFWGDNCNIYHNMAYKMVENLGWLFKQRTFDENICPEKTKLGSRHLYRFAQEKKALINNVKEVRPETISGNYNYLSGLISGYFDADGTIHVGSDKGNSIRLGSISIPNLQRIQIALNAFGIKSVIYTDRLEAGYRLLPDGKGGMKNYYCQTANELHISRDSIEIFYDVIKLKNKDKYNKIKQIIDSRVRAPYKNKFVDMLDSIEKLPAEDVYDCTIPEISAFSCNGVYVHNCCEVSLYGYDDKGNSGFEFCNLTEINAKKCKTEAEFYDACKASAIIGTLQAGYTDFPYLGKVTENIVKREALLGCSMTGVQDNPAIALNPEIQRKGAEVIKAVNKEIAAKIGINQAARTTVIKPAGSTSSLLGTSSGIHPSHAKKYLRRVQCNKNDPALAYFRLHNPKAVELSVWDQNKKTEVITFVCEVPEGARTKLDVDAIELLKNVKLTQQNWIEYGTNEKISVQPWLRHNVSNTISVKNSEWNEVTKYIYENRNYFAGVSLLPESGDKDYPQAPFCTIYEPKEILSIYGDGSLMASGLIVDGLKAFDDNLWAACDCALGIGEKLELTDEQKNLKNGQLKKVVDKLTEKEDWVRRAKQYAERYFNNDLRKMTYCLKDVNNWKTYLDLKREWVDVDWNLFYEDENNVDLIKQEGGCDGQKCEIDGLKNSKNIKG